jgi:transposase
MTANKAIAKLLKLHKILKVSDLQYRRDGSLSLSVKPYKNGARCPDCGRRGKIVRTRPVARQWRDLPVAGREVTLVYFPREIVCATHGRCEEEIPWSAPHARITTRLEYAILRLCQTMTQKAAAELLRLSASTLSEQLHRSVTRRRADAPAIVSADCGSSVLTRFRITSATVTRRWFTIWSGPWSFGSVRDAAAKPSTDFSMRCSVPISGRRFTRPAAT